MKEQKRPSKKTSEKAKKKNKWKANKGPLRTVQAKSVFSPGWIIPQSVAASEEPGHSKRLLLLRAGSNWKRFFVDENGLAQPCEEPTSTTRGEGPMPTPVEYFFRPFSALPALSVPDDEVQSRAGHYCPNQVCTLGMLFMGWQQKLRNNIYLTNIAL